MTRREHVREFLQRAQSGLSGRPTGSGVAARVRNRPFGATGVNLSGTIRAQLALRSKPECLVVSLGSSGLFPKPVGSCCNGFLCYRWICVFHRLTRGSESLLLRFVVQRPIVLGVLGFESVGDRVAFLWQEGFDKFKH